MSQLLCLVLVDALLKIVPGYIFVLLHRRNGEEKNDKRINRLERLVYFKNKGLCTFPLLVIFGVFSVLL